jgi:hypothetical protein
MEDRETALWKMQETFGWTISPDVDLSWTEKAMCGGSRPATAGASRRSRQQRISNSPYGRPGRPGRRGRLPPHNTHDVGRHENTKRVAKKGKSKTSSFSELHAEPRPNTAKHEKAAKWSNRLLTVPNDLRKRGVPEEIRSPHPTLGGAVRFLEQQHEQLDARFESKRSPYYTSSPYPIQAPPPSKQALEDVTKQSRGRGGKIIPDEHTREWLHLQSVTMHGGTRSRGLAIDPLGLSPPNAQKGMSTDLSSATSRRFHTRALGRRLFFRMKHPKKIPSMLRGELHVMMVRHHFEPVPPQNWPAKKKIGRREGARVVKEWRGATEHVWDLLEDANTVFGGRLLISCEDFYLLERAHMWCRTFQEGSMPVAQRHKVVQLGVLEDEDDLLPGESESANRSFHEEQEMPRHYSKHYPRQQPRRRRHASAVSLQMKDPVEALSVHRRTATACFSGSNRFKKPGDSAGSSTTLGPGSFNLPTAFEQQVESRKRNLRFTASASMTSPLKRMDPEEAALLGMREGPGPAHFVVPERETSGGVKIGPGFSSGLEPPISLQCKRLVEPWKRKDRALQQERAKLDREMRIIRGKEADLVQMSRGLRSIIAQRISKNARREPK